MSETKKTEIREDYGKLDLTMLKEITEADGIAGNEKEVSRVMKKYLEGYADEISYDNLGSIIFLKKGKGNGPKIMMNGHMDEVGFFVSKIEDSGLIRLQSIGGWWGHVLPAQELRITTQKGDKLYGIIGSRAPHGLSAEVRNKVMEVKDMFLDLGVSGKQEVIDLGVQLGDIVTPTTEFKVMNNPNFLMAKAWDDRVGAAIAIDVMKNLKGVETEADIYSVGTVQEEVGLRGAKTAGYMVKPDIEFAIDVTLNNDYPESLFGEALASGVVVSIMDGSHIDHRGLVEQVEAICDELKIDHVRSIFPAGGTDAGEIHKSFNGIFSLTLSIPSRSIHSHRSIIHKKDYIDTVKMLTEFCKRCNWDSIEKIKQSMR